MTDTVPWIDAVDRRENWQALSICGPEHDEILFSAGRRGRTRDRLVEEAKRLCRSCPVQADCLQVAVERREKNGVWGGHDFSVKPGTPRRRPPNKEK